MFGVSLTDLYERDGLAVPLIVLNCIQAVDLYGLKVISIYQGTGLQERVQMLREKFDNGE